MSRSAVSLKAWVEAGKVIPVCINHGCTNKVTCRHWSDAGIPSLKTECSKCSGARVKGKTLSGITFHKKDYCENKNGQLGWKCPLEGDLSGFPSDIYDMDHLDGDHHNNDPNNVMTICKICHSRKGKESGDFNGQKGSSRRMNKPSPEPEPEPEPEPV